MAEVAFKMDRTEEEEDAVDVPTKRAAQVRLLRWGCPAWEPRSAKPLRLAAAPECDRRQ